MYSKVLADRVRVLKEPSEEGDKMCRELEALYLDGEKRGIKEEAMNALRIPENERGTYTDLLAKQ